MNKTANIRFIVFASLAVVVSLSQPDQAISQTAPSPRVPCTAIRSKKVIDKKGNMQTLSNDHTLSNTQYNCGNPTDEEQLMLEYINFARAYPDSEGIILSTTQDPGVVNEYNGYPSSSRSEVATDFPTYPARPPLAMNADLLTAARGHDNEMIIVDSQYHVGPDGNPGSRIEAAGYTDWSAWGENVFAFGDSDVFYDDAAFLIDFGNSDLGHRHNIMNFASTDAIYTEVGLGMVAGNGNGNPNGNVGPVLTTEDFVTGPNVFVLGVVYSDSNQNGFYDEGEGDAGVKITLSSGSSYYAVTSASGGYAIPYTGSGQVTVTASGGIFKTPVMKTVTLSGVNVKVDFGPDLTGFPSQVTLVTPVDDTVVNTNVVDFVWDSIPVATKYHVQIATDAGMKNLVFNDSLADTSVVFSNLNDTNTYFWRVLAENTTKEYIGPWSPIASFSVALPPSSVVLLTPPNGSSVGDSNVSFTWSANNEADDYWFILDSNINMLDTVYQDPSTQGNTYETASSFYFTVGQTYYWEVLAVNGNGLSNPGTPWSFTFGAPSSVTPSNTDGLDAVTISPNPSAGSALIQFTLPISEDVSLRVFNTLGEQVQTLNLGMLPAGTNEYLWDGSGLLAGSYVCQIRMGEQIQSARVVMLK